MAVLPMWKSTVSLALLWLRRVQMRHIPLQTRWRRKLPVSSEGPFGLLERAPFPNHYFSPVTLRLAARLRFVSCVIREMN